MRASRIVRGVHVVACLSLVAGLLAVSVSIPTPQVARAAANSVVGDGSPASCTRDELADELAVGGAITFDCGGAAIIAITSPVPVPVDATLSGAGLISLDGLGTQAILVVAAGVNLTVDEMTFTRGTSTGNGGAIHNSGTLEVDSSRFHHNAGSSTGGAIYNAPSGSVTIDSSRFDNNSSTIWGGAIDSEGSLSVTASTFDANTSGTTTASGFGGAIFSAGPVTITTSTLKYNRASKGGAYMGSGVLTVDRSTFHNNSSTSNNGAAVSIGGSSLDDQRTIVNSTFSRNTAAGTGTVFLENATLTILASTFSDNDAVSGVSGISRSGGAVKIGHTLLSSGDTNCTSGIMGSLGHNLSSDSSCAANAFNAPTDQNSTDPNLEALADNGGPTMTHALTEGSAAIDAGNATVCATNPINGIDQRGESRAVDGNGNGTTTCDIGAFEYAPPDTTDPLSSHSFNTTPVFEGWFAGSVTVLLNATDDDSGVHQICYLLDDAVTPACISGASASVTVDSNGIHDLEYWAVDVATNEEQPHNAVTVKVDASPPTTSVTPERDPINGWYAAPVDVVLSATDGESGLAQLCYRFDAEASECVAPDSNGATVVTVSESHTLTFWAEDRAGIASAVDNHDIMIDTDAPVAGATFSPDPPPGSWTNKIVNISIAGSDDRSSVNEICYRMSGAQQRSLRCAIRSTWPVKIINDGQTTVEYFVRDAAGNQSATASRVLLVDRAAPRITSGPDIEIVSGQAPRLGIELAWAGSDSPVSAITHSGIARYRAQVSTDNAVTWKSITLTSPTATQATLYVLPGQAYRFRVSVTDGAGNTSGWIVSDPQTFSLVDDNVATYTGNWWTTTSSTALGTTFRANSRVHADATYAFCGSGFVWLAATRPNGGIAAVFIDGSTTPLNVSLHSSPAKHRRVVFQQTFADAGCHTIRIIVTGTNQAPSSGTVVTIDGFIVRNMYAPPPE